MFLFNFQIFSVQKYKSKMQLSFLNSKVGDIIIIAKIKAEAFPIRPVIEHNHQFNHI